MFKTNEGLLDRSLRVTLGAVLLVLAFFWLSGAAQIVAYIFGAILTATGFAGFCGLYALLKLNTCSRDSKPVTLKNVAILIGIFLIVLVLTGYASNMITKKKFLEEYGKMNGYYKQTLFLTGQNKRTEAITNYESWTKEYAQFKAKYTTYRPYALRGDTQFDADLAKVSDIIALVKAGVYTGDLPTTHKQLEEVRPIFQGIFKRNNFSMLAMLLTDFHDLMEKNIEAADSKDAQQVVETYTQSDQVLKQIEAEQNDQDIQTIRKNLDTLLKLAQENKTEELPAQAAQLKSSFVKVYLRKG